MIVPPAAVKSPYYSNGVLRSMWTKAAVALKQARELVIMGFTLSTQCLRPPYCLRLWAKPVS